MLTKGLVSLTKGLVSADHEASQLDQGFGQRRPGRFCGETTSTRGERSRGPRFGEGIRAGGAERGGVGALGASSEDKGRVKV